MLSLHAVSTIALFGLIWFVQLVHYPLFHRVGPEGFAEYESSHQRRTSCVVAPLMCIEALTSVALMFSIHVGWPRFLALLGVVLVACIWLSTVLVQVPCHRKLTRGYDAEVTQRLVLSNWLRTVAWTCRTPIAVVLLVAANS
jgi:hypothetical protein